MLEYQQVSRHIPRGGVCGKCCIGLGENGMAVVHEFPTEDEDAWDLVKFHQILQA